jgi:hypothetical protein
MKEIVVPSWFNEEEFQKFSQNYNKTPFSLENLNGFSAFVVEDKSSKAMKMDAEMSKGTGIDNKKDRDSARKRVERSDDVPAPKSKDNLESPPPPEEAQYTPEELAQMEYEQTYFVDGIPRSLDPKGREEVRAILQPRDIDAILQPNIIGEVPKEIDENIHYGHAITMISLLVSGFPEEDIQSRVEATPKLTQVTPEIFEKSKNIVSRLLKKEGWSHNRLAGMSSWSEMGLGDFREAKSELVLYLEETDALNEFSQTPGILGITVNIETILESSNLRSKDTSMCIINSSAIYFNTNEKEALKVYKKLLPVLSGKSAYSKIKNKLLPLLHKNFNTDTFKLNLIYEILSGKYTFTEDHKFGPLAASDVLLTPHSTIFITSEYCQNLLDDKAFKLKIKIKKDKQKESNNSNLRYVLDGKLSTSPILHQLALSANNIGMLEGEDDIEETLKIVEENLPIIVSLIAENEFEFVYSINLNAIKKEDSNISYNFMTVKGKEIKIPVSVFTDPNDHSTSYEKPEYPKADEVRVSPMKEERDYKKEYKDYHGKPKQISNRSKRVTARRRLEKEGRVKKGDGKDVHHKNGNPQDNSSSNLQVMGASKNRAIKDSYNPIIDEEHGAGEIGTAELVKKYLKDTPFSKIIRKKDDRSNQRG